MDNNGRTRAVVTGMGVLSCLGKSVGDYWDGLTSGRSGIAELTLTDTSGYPCKIGGEVRDFDPTQYVDRKESRRLARFSQFAEPELYPDLRGPFTQPHNAEANI